MWTTNSTPTRRTRRRAERVLPAAGGEILRECIRIPADYVDRPIDEGGDPACGLSNHEGPRLEYPEADDHRHRRSAIPPRTCGFDDYGNLVWTVSDPDDGIDPDDKRVVYFDGHTDTVQALRSTWREKLGRHRCLRRADRHRRRRP